jgi:uncharacterized damage-inducible protein DinB
MPQSRSMSRIARSLDAFRNVRMETLETARPLTAEQASFRPDRESWSLAQNLDHLIRIDGIYREHIQKLLDLAREGKRLTIVMPWGESDPRPQFVPSMVMPMLELPFTMMNMFVPSMVRETFLRFPVMKAKSPKRAEPESGRDLTELLSGLRTSFETTRLLLEGLLPANAERVALIHPVFGRNTIPDILGLMTAHERRHQAQMAALLRDPRFPKS